jgi:UDP-glucose 4-epimerase
MTWLLTGGAGYIGSHIVQAFHRAGTEVVVLDNLATGFRTYVPEGVPFIQGSVTDPDAVARTFDEHDIAGVIHLAGLKYAGVSVQQPLNFYRENVTGMQVLLEAVTARGISNVVLSSSASWYGTPDAEVVTEDAPARPESPYGQTKTTSEWLLRAVAVAEPTLRQTSLRYFNVVGSGAPELADHSPHNLFPKVLRAITAGQAAIVNGVDYPTPDGSCIRDYVHVVDVAEAHVVAARRLESGERCAPAYNVGRGTGSSVREVLDAMHRITGIDFPVEEQPRRPGDPARIVGAVELIAADLSWRARFDLDDMVSSAWQAWQHQLARYGGAPTDGGTIHLT